MGLVPVLAALLAASCAYYAAALLAMLAFRRQTPADTGSVNCWPGVSILKPAVGAGADFSQALDSHADQDYPDFEILVGVGVDDLAARAAVAEIQAKHQSPRIKPIPCPRPGAGSNGKVQALEELARNASKPVWIVTDADITVPEQFLRSVTEELSTPNAGLVTCLYRAEPGTGLATQIEACRINTEFPAQVLLAQRLQGMRFALGSTLALRSETLARAGGFASVRGVIGDDFHLGANVAALGLDVRLCVLPVCTQLPAGDGWKEAWSRQLRWSRTIRKQRPLGHAGLVVTFAVLWAAVALLTDPMALWPLALAALALRATAAIAASRLLRCPRILPRLSVLPAADICAAAVWLWSYFGSRVYWSGRTLRLGPGGRIRT